MYCEKHDEQKVLWAGKYKCKSCNREYQNEWWKKNKSIQRKRANENHSKARFRNVSWLIDYVKTHPCVDCGENDFIVLDFDHRDPSEKEHNISQMINHSLEKLKEEVDKCDVRCSNCHRRRTAIQFSYYKYLEK